VASFDIDLSFRTDNTNPTQQPDDYGGIAAPDRFAKSAARKLVKGRVVKTYYYMADSLWVNVRGFPQSGLRRRPTQTPRQRPRELPRRAGRATMAAPVMVKTPDTPTSFEAALAELEGIVATMEGGKLPLAESLAAYRRGAILLEYCQATLKDAQQQVEVLERGVLKGFVPTADANGSGDDEA
jgi:exodeoxyribonuclease VII small subunit